ncbi:phosphomevalonate kinase [Clostridium sp. YIM B02515]|uniref:phosphomevalonate kinase n=1 Tax=Clostridium rhizosphaerae TaxID=2803861 RepID=A0ABS1T957_9CLOT|nr:phosphomevalonate kinase [Clostridium rhizosphaerae]MBL4935883.1 phosphomevalonate kinase [Clostridium rhizosphaerae]
MTYLSYSVKVPGKLMIAGEYAVLEPNQKAVVAAVNRYVTAYIEPFSQNCISLPQMELEDITWEINDESIQFSISDSRLGFIGNAIVSAVKFLKEKSVMLSPFKLQIKSQLDDPATGKKYGLGSSAAVVAAVISAVLYLHSAQLGILELDDIFKLSAIAHVKTQKSGSGADIAAAVYGDWLEYSAFSAEWLLKQLDQEKILTDIVKKTWPNLSIRSLTSPANLQLAVGWTKESAATAPMIQKVHNFRCINFEAYSSFLKESQDSVSSLIRSFETNNCNGAINALSQNRRTLRRLGENAGISIETKELKTLCDIAENFGSGKPSGAGGGDCGIAFIIGKHKVQELYEAWQEAGIEPLDLCVSKTGIKVEVLKKVHLNFLNF